MSLNIAEKTLRLKQDFDEVYEAGNTKGYTKGYTEGYDAGYAEGEASGGSDFPVEEYFAKTVTELTLTGATILYANAIANQNSLESIDLPDVIKIDSQAFNGCSNLSTVVLYEGLRTIAGSAFQVCPKITSIEIPSTVETVGWNAFTGCTNLETVTFLGKPTMIGSQFSPMALPVSVKTINVPWAVDEVPGAPWGATAFENINYGYTKEE